MDPYTLKRSLIRPYTSAMRRLLRWLDPVSLQMLEIHNFGPGFVAFGLRLILDREILHRASVDDVRVVVDVGAFDGQWSASVGERYSDAMIQAFEPDPQSFAAARRRLAGLGRVKLHAYGLADRNEQVPLLQHGPGSTAHPEAALRLDATADVSRTVLARMRDVKDVIDGLDLRRIDFMKINIEGGEFRLLERLIDTGHVARVRCLLVQFHEWYPDAYALRRKLHRKLERTHALDFSDYFVWERWTRKDEPSARRGAVAHLSSVSAQLWRRPPPALTESATRREPPPDPPPGPRGA